MSSEIGGDAVDLAGVKRLHLLCLQPVHHVLEFAQLYRCAERLPERSQRLERHLWMRSALADRRPFEQLPVDSVAELPPEDEAHLSEELLTELRKDDAACLLIGDPSRAEQMRAAGVRLAAVRQPDFRVGHPESVASRAASDAFFEAAARASPRWSISPHHRPWPSGGRGPRILIHQSRSHVGDTLWVTPLLRAIRRRFEDARVTLAGSPTLRRVLALNPDADELLTWAPEGGEAERDRVRREIVSGDFDAALFAFVRRPKSRWLAEAAADCGIERRINLEYFERADDGVAHSDLFTCEGWFFWNTMASPRLLMHALVPLAENPEPEWLEDRRVRFDVGQEPRAEAAWLLAAGPVADRPFAVLAPGGLSSERWPVDGFARLAVRLEAELGLHVLLEGSPDERELLESVARRAGSLGARGPGSGLDARHDSLGVFAALLERASLLVANDSAPIHLAEAIGTPTLYFAQHEKLTHSHPAGERQLALFEERRNRIADITSGQAFEAARWLLSG